VNCINVFKDREYLLTFLSMKWTLWFCKMLGMLLQADQLLVSQVLRSLKLLV
jgi:hypothetical protein